MENIAHCHCTMCRKFHGAAFSTFAEVKLENFKIVNGEEYLASYQSERNVVRKFCKCCGSSLLFESSYNRKDGTIEVALAAFDNLEPVKVKSHIYTDSQVEWLPLNDELPKHCQFRDE